MKKLPTLLGVLLFLGVITSATACAPTDDEKDILPPISTEESSEITPVPPVSPEPVAEEPVVAEPVTPTVKNAQYVKIQTDGLNVRAAANTSSAVRGQVNADTALLCLGEENGFYKTLYRGKTAYVSANKKYTKTFEMAPMSEVIEKVIEEGCRQIGAPYAYGATRYHNGKGKLLSGFTTDKFDCSSLMQYIFYKGANVILEVN
ncbi:MAG: C40 family peptidase, partial [Clostridia bacterium]|nr:C40 family peptidase [Clostridia bacterium]